MQAVQLSIIALLLLSIAAHTVMGSEHTWRGCLGLSYELTQIAGSCCGSEMEYCEGTPIPFVCEPECSPVWQSFFARCESEIRSNRKVDQYLRFEALCERPGGGGVSTSTSAN